MFEIYRKNINKNKIIRIEYSIMSIPSIVDASHE